MKKPFLISVSMYLIFFWQFLLPNFSFWKSDAELIYIPARYYIYEKITLEKEFPFWTERMFSGFPVYADFENAYLNPINVLSIILLGPINSYKFLHFFSYLFGSLCFYLWLKNKRYSLISFAIANLIFYFNTFMLNHQIHFNVIAGFYLFPAIIYYIDEIINKFEFKKIIILSVIISYIALWGHAQTTFLICLGGLIYFIFYSFKNWDFKKSIYFGILTLLLVLIQIIPQYLPSYNLYRNSLREEIINFRQGSLTPGLISLTFIPNLFGKSYSYTGNTSIYTEYTYTETYIYLGITSLILGVFGILLLKKDKFFFFLYSYILIFFILAFNAYNPLLNENTPIINVFRYWQRSMLFYSFAIAVLAGTLIQNINNFLFEKKELIKSILFLTFPILYLFVISLFQSNFILSFKKGGIEKISEIYSLNYLKKIDDFYFLILITVIILVLIFLKFKKTFLKKQIDQNFVNISIYLIILCDLFFFNLDVLEYRIDNISSYNFPKIDEKYSNTRIYNKNTILDGMEHTLVKSWSPFGYSQFKEEEYSKLFYDKGLNNLRKSKEKFPTESYKDLDKFGIKYLLESNQEINLNNRKVDLILEDIDGEFITKKEGEIEIRLNTSKEQKVNLLLKHNPNWEITLNNKLIQYSKEGLFLGLEIQKGENIIRAKYIPKDFFQGLTISILLFIPAIILIKFKRRLLNE